MIWWFMIDDDWWWLMNFDDVCMLYSLCFYSVLGFLCFFKSKSEIPLSKWKFSPRYLQALQHFSPVVDASRHHLCCPYCSARTTIQLADDRCRRMASYDVVRGHDLEGTCPSCKLPWDLMVTAKRVVILKASRLGQLCCKHAALQDVGTHVSCCHLSLYLEIGLWRTVGVKALSGSERDACLSTES